MCLFCSFSSDVVEEDGMSAVECFAESNRMTSGEVLIHQCKRYLNHKIPCTWPLSPTSGK